MHFSKLTTCLFTFIHRGFWHIVFVMGTASCQVDSGAEEKAEETLFSLLPAETTSIDFVNDVQDQADYNILTYRNFYNGGGVAIGDINQDNLPDLYFTANLQANKLYLNKGNWQFEDISESAGVGGTRAWSTGVTMVDINHDGWLDIYVCNSGDVQGDNKENELFINNGALPGGDLTFTESAEEWGLSNAGYSTHASFFDYDQDGDLDCYLLNNSFKSPNRIELFRKSREDIDTEGGDKLFRNDGSTFTDVTEEAGIFTSDIGFGLGVSVSDINGDMLPDIYVSNDFWERDYLYINQGNGTFREELETRISMTSMNSMGADIADLNNDGFPEIMTTDMLPADNYRLKSMTQFEPFRVAENKTKAGYHHQFMQNCLQVNNGTTQFREVSFMANVASTDWSWGTLMLDFNLDGKQDIFVSNGIQRDLTNFDFVDFISDSGQIDKIVRSSGKADFTQFLPHMPSTKLANYAFINHGDLSFTNQAEQLGLATPSFSNGSAYGDLDDDGDLDLVINNANMPAFVYRNDAVQQGKNEFLKIKLAGPAENPLGIGAKVIIKHGPQIQVLQQYVSRGFESSVEPGLWFGLGTNAKADTVTVIWPDLKEEVFTNVAANTTLRPDYTNAAPSNQKKPSAAAPLYTERTSEVFKTVPVHSENEFNDFDQERLLHRKLSEEGPRIISGDVNADGLPDLLLLGAADDPNKLFLQKQDGTFTQSSQQAFINDKGLESTCAAFFDADGDGDLDLLVGHGGNERQKGIANFYLRYYDNDGKGNFVINLFRTPQVGGNLSTIAPADFDQDGDMDLFLGGRCVPGDYGLIPGSYLLQNRGDGTWNNLTTQEIGQLGMVTDARWADIDQDQDMDLLVVGEWMPVTIFENTPNGLRKSTIENSSGWWSAITAADLDNDGDQDFILGNWGLNSKFNASQNHPLKLHTKDFDGNGKVESVIEWHPSGSTTAYPFPAKMDLMAQIPALKKDFLTYDAYAKSSFEEVFSPGDERRLQQLSAQRLESVILWNDPEGYCMEVLPPAAQVAPVYSIIAEDLDQDNCPDLLLLGNLYGLKPEVGRLDANKGVFLKGYGNRSFKALPAKESGFWIDGQVRDAIALEGPGNTRRLFIARNNRPLLVYENE
ncbi:MAG: VCBS repeat-containing protein [Cyclobacteriaceae bacterium]